jgi:DNA polymerase-3 subunit beta
MKFHISKERILEGLQRVQNIISSRTTLPILSNILIQAEKGGLCLTTTDLDVGVRCKIEADVAKAGSTTLPGRKLFSILREVAAPEIEIEVDDKNTASIRCGGSFFRIMGLPEVEFPKFPHAAPPASLTLDQAVLGELLKRTSYAASTDETRFVLNGVLMCIKAGKLTCVATDGRRLALAETELLDSKGKEAEFILPTKAVAEILRLLADKGVAKLYITENQFILDLESALLVTKLIEGTFPNYRQVIPSETKERITLEREPLLCALHRASILTSEKAQAVKLNFAKNTLTITASAPEVGEAKETLAINYKGKEMTVGFNPQFLMDPLRHLDADEVSLELTDDLSPGVLKINAPFLYVLMPMRLN